MQFRNRYFEISSSSEEGGIDVKDGRQERTSRATWFANSSNKILFGTPSSEVIRRFVKCP